MSLTIFEQLQEALNHAKRPVIVLKAAPTVDDFAAAFCIRSLLLKMDKQCEIVSCKSSAPETLKFLSNFATIRQDFEQINSLTIRVNVDHAKADGLSYSVEGRDLVISLAPKTGYWKNNDVRVACNDYRYDLVLAIGTPDRASIGQIGTTYADFFLRTATVIIDHAAENEHFGTINAVDIAATSVCEVCADIFSHIDPTFIDESIATTLLTGVMSKTKSFRTPNVSPKTLDVIKFLIEKGGKREEIIQHLYRTRSVETLRLWGRALARLKSDESKGLVWTLVTRQDFVTAGATEDALEDVIEELFSMSPHAKVAVLFSETKDGRIAIQLHASHPHDALALTAPFRPVGTKNVTHFFLQNTNIVSAEKIIITHVKEKIGEHRSLS